MIPCSYTYVNLCICCAANYWGFCFLCPASEDEVLVLCNKQTSQPARKDVFCDPFFLGLGNLEEAQAIIATTRQTVTVDVCQRSALSQPSASRSTPLHFFELRKEVSYRSQSQSSSCQSSQCSYQVHPSHVTKDLSSLS